MVCFLWKICEYSLLLKRHLGKESMKRDENDNQGTQRRCRLNSMRRAADARVQWTMIHLLHFSVVESDRVLVKSRHLKEYNYKLVIIWCNRKIYGEKIRKTWVLEIGILSCKSVQITPIIKIKDEILIHIRKTKMSRDWMVPSVQGGVVKLPMYL